MPDTLTEARELIATNRAELESIADEMAAIAGIESQSGRFAELEARAEALVSANRDIERRFPHVHRKTAPNAIGTDRSRRGMSNHEAAADYRKLHGIAGPLDDGGFRSMGQFLSILGSGLHDDRIVAMRAAAASGITGAGGALVPEQFAAELLHPPVEGELIMPRARRFSMNAGTLKVATLDNLSNENGETFGGFTGEWVEEGGEFTDQTPTTSQITLTRRKLGLFTIASSELVSDSDYEQHLLPALQQAVSDHRDYAFFRGTGVGQPKGILNDAALITVPKEAGQAADTLVVQNLDKMYSRIHPRLIRNCRWYCNPTCIPQLLALVRSTGTSGEVVPVINESSGSFSMYGLPVELTSKLPVLGDTGDILLADVSQYGIGFGRGIAIDRSEHFRFQNDQIVWRVIWRGDGQGLWRAPFTPRHGETLSWCVALAERA